MLTCVGGETPNVWTGSYVYISTCFPHTVWCKKVQRAAFTPVTWGSRDAFGSRRGPVKVIVSDSARDDSASELFAWCWLITVHIRTRQHTESVLQGTGHGYGRVWKENSRFIQTSWDTRYRRWRDKVNQYFCFCYMRKPNTRKKTENMESHRNHTFMSL